MIELLWQFTPFFALVCMGALAVRSGVVPRQGLGAMNAFVLFFALPALVFRLSASGALQQAGLGGLLGAYGLAGIAVLGLGLLLGARAGLPRRDSGMLALATAFPNTGFLGLPLLTGLLGHLAAGPVAATLLVDVLLLSSLSLAWGHSDAHRGAGGAQALRAVLGSLKGALRNPLLWSMAAGLLVSWLSVSLPRPIDETLHLLSLSATPAALFTLGAMLAGSEAAEQSQRGGMSAPALSVLIKLVLHPALVWCAGTLLAHLGWSVPRTGLITLTLAAALPSASNVSLLAQREGADVRLVGRVILGSTALAIISLAIWAHTLGVVSTRGQT